MSTSLTDTTISGKRPVEDPCCSSRVEAEAGYKRSEDRLSTTTSARIDYRGSTRRRVPRNLEEENRGRIDYKTEEGIDYRENRGRIDYKTEEGPTTGSTTRVEPKSRTEEGPTTGVKVEYRSQRLLTTRTQQEDY